jgi:hypothetical protein
MPIFREIRALNAEIPRNRFHENHQHSYRSVPPHVAFRPVASFEIRPASRTSKKATLKTSIHWSRVIPDFLDDPLFLEGIKGLLQTRFNLLESSTYSHAH